MAKPILLFLRSVKNQSPISSSVTPPMPLPHRDPTRHEFRFGFRASDTLAQRGSAFDNPTPPIRTGFHTHANEGVWGTGSGATGLGHYGFTATYTHPDSRGTYAGWVLVPPQAPFSGYAYSWLNKPRNVVAGTTMPSVSSSHTKGATGYWCGTKTGSYAMTIFGSSWSQLN